MKLIKFPIVDKIPQWPENTDPETDYNHPVKIINKEVYAEYLGGIDDIILPPVTYPDNSPPEVPVIITDVSGVGLIEADADFSEITIQKGQPVTITASVPVIPDSSFNVPITSTDGGRTIYVRGNVVSNVLSVDLTIDESREWRVTEEGFNSKITPVKFTFNGMTITCVQ